MEAQKLEEIARKELEEKNTTLKKDTDIEIQNIKQLTPQELQEEKRNLDIKIATELKEIEDRKKLQQDNDIKKKDVIKKKTEETIIEKKTKEAIQKELEEAAKTEEERQKTDLLKPLIEPLSKYKELWNLSNDKNIKTYYNIINNEIILYDCSAFTDDVKIFISNNILNNKEIYINIKYNDDKLIYTVITKDNKKIINYSELNNNFKNILKETIKFILDKISIDGYTLKKIDMYNYGTKINNLKFNNLTAPSLINDILNTFFEKTIEKTNDIGVKKLEIEESLFEKSSEKITANKKAIKQEAKELLKKIELDKIIKEEESKEKIKKLKRELDADKIIIESIIIPNIIKRDYIFGQYIKDINKFDGGYNENEKYFIEEYYNKIQELNNENIDFIRKDLKYYNENNDNIINYKKFKFNKKEESFNTLYDFEQYINEKAKEIKENKDKEIKIKEAEQAIKDVEKIKKENFQIIKNLIKELDKNKKNIDTKIINKNYILDDNERGLIIEYYSNIENLKEKIIKYYNDYYNTSDNNIEFISDIDDDDLNNDEIDKIIKDIRRKYYINEYKTFEFNNDNKEIILVSSNDFIEHVNNKIKERKKQEEERKITEEEERLKEAAKQEAEKIEEERKITEERLKAEQVRRDTEAKETAARIETELQVAEQARIKLEAETREAERIKAEEERLKEAAKQVAEKIEKEKNITEERLKAEQVRRDTEAKETAARIKTEAEKERLKAETEKLEEEKVAKLKAAELEEKRLKAAIEIQKIQRGRIARKELDRMRAEVATLKSEEDKKISKINDLIVKIKEIFIEETFSLPLLQDVKENPYKKFISSIKDKFIQILENYPPNIENINFEDIINNENIQKNSEYFQIYTDMMNDIITKFKNIFNIDNNDIIKNIQILKDFLNLNHIKKLFDDTQSIRPQENPVLTSNERNAYDTYNNMREYYINKLKEKYPKNFTTNDSIIDDKYRSDPLFGILKIIEDKKQEEEAKIKPEIDFSQRKNIASVSSDISSKEEDYSESLSSQNILSQEEDEEKNSDSKTISLLGSTVSSPLQTPRDIDSSISVATAKLSEQERKEEDERNDLLDESNKKLEIINSILENEETIQQIKNDEDIQKQKEIREKNRLIKATIAAASVGEATKIVPFVDIKKYRENEKEFTSKQKNSDNKTTLSNIANNIGLTQEDIINEKEKINTKITEYNKIQKPNDDQIKNHIENLKSKALLDLNQIILNIDDNDDNKKSLILLIKENNELKSDNYYDIIKSYINKIIKYEKIDKSELKSILDIINNNTEEIRKLIKSYIIFQNIDNVSNYYSNIKDDNYENTYSIYNISLETEKNILKFKHNTFTFGNNINNVSLILQKINDNIIKKNKYIIEENNGNKLYTIYDNNKDIIAVIAEFNKDYKRIFIIQAKADILKENLKLELVLFKDYFIKNNLEYIYNDIFGIKNLLNI